MREHCNGLRWPTPHFRRCVTAQKNKISKVQQLNTIFISEQRLFSCPRQSCCVRAQGREMFLQSVGQLEYQWGCWSCVTSLQGLPGDLTQERALSRAVPGCPRDRDSAPHPTAPGDSLVSSLPGSGFSQSLLSLVARTLQLRARI